MSRHLSDPDLNTGTISIVWAPSAGCYIIYPPLHFPRLEPICGDQDIQTVGTKGSRELTRSHSVDLSLGFSPSQVLFSKRNRDHEKLRPCFCLPSVTISRWVLPPMESEASSWVHAFLFLRTMTHLGAYYFDCAQTDKDGPCAKGN